MTSVILSRGIEVALSNKITFYNAERSRIFRVEIINVHARSARWRFRHNSRRHFSRFRDYFIYFKHFMKEVAVGRYSRMCTHDDLHRAFVKSGETNVRHYTLMSI